MCQPHNIFGFQKDNNGGMAEYVKFPKTSVISRVPDDMSVEAALLIEPYGCSKHAVDRGSITNEDVVVISGAGTLGLGTISSRSSRLIIWRRYSSAVRLQGR